MKTNFTIGKLFTAAFALAAITLSSCNKDEDTTPDISGKYALTSVVLVDGNTGDSDDASDLVIYGGSTNPETDPPYTAIIPAGDNAASNQGALFFVNEILKGAAPCTNQDTGTWTYLIDMQSGGDLAFECTSESIEEVLGTWVLTGTSSLTLTIESESLGTVPVTLSNLEITDTTISGTINGFPMVKNATEPIGLTNLQYIKVEATITKQ
ncbi:MAG: hypothetical protein KDC79_10480 [Cyclobacteriaceae bacterium]|nr:hypothetical protein [Cyclobacteriaceae bacterium]